MVLIGNYPSAKSVRTRPSVVLDTSQAATVVATEIAELVPVYEALWIRK